MQSNVKILAAGPDTYVLNVYSTNANCQPGKKQLDNDLKMELDALKQQAQEDEEDIETRFLFDRVPLVMKTRGAEGFNWILRNASVALAINRGSKMALLAQARLSSEYLWKHQHLTLGAITSHVHVMLASIFGQYITLQPSALDLAVDVLGFDVNSIPNLRECFVTRAQLDDELPAKYPEGEDGLLDGPDHIRRRWRRITGLPFGARNGQVSALLYDKTHEIKYHSPEKTWFWDSWQHRAEQQGFCLLPNARIWRTEIRLKRQAINEMMVKGLFHGIDSAYEIDQHLAGLWAYAVGHTQGGDDGLPDGWLRYVIPSDQDTNRARWPVHPDWQVIQSAFMPKPLPPSPLKQSQQEQEDLLQQVDAYLESNPMELTSPRPRASYKRQKQAAQPSPLVVELEEEDGIHSPFDLRPYVRQRKRQINQQKAIAALVGWASTYEAWQPRPTSSSDQENEGDQVEPDISDTLHHMFDQALPYMEERQKDYPTLVHKKRVIYSVEPQQPQKEV